MVGPVELVVGDELQILGGVHSSDQHIEGHIYPTVATSAQIEALPSKRPVVLPHHGWKEWQIAPANIFRIRAACNAETRLEIQLPEECRM